MLVKAYLLGMPTADRATNHNKQVLQHDASHVLLAINHAAFLARIMEGHFLAVARLQGRGLQVTGFEMFSERPPVRPLEKLRPYVE